MGVFSRSWELAKTTFSVMKKEKELFVFPVLSVIFSIIFALAILFPTIIVYLIGGEGITLGIMEFLLLFLLYFGIAFIAVFFNFCVVYTSAVAFSGKSPRFWETIKYALSKIHLILLWSLVSATIGLIFRILDGIAEKTKGIGGIFAAITLFLFKLSWAIATIFVIPVIVYQNVGPFDALKKSVETIKKTWGENLVAFFGLGLVIFITFALALIIGCGITILGFIISPLIGVIFLLLSFFIILFIFLIFGVASSVFNTALYVYAETGQVVGGYDKESMKNAFRQKRKILLGF